MLKNVIPNYNIVQDSLPSRSCMTCRYAITNGMSINLPNYTEWLNILLNLPPLTRSSSNCACFLCDSLKPKTDKETTSIPSAITESGTIVSPVIGSYVGPAMAKKLNIMVKPVDSSSPKESHSVRTPASCPVVGPNIGPSRPVGRPSAG